MTAPALALAALLAAAPAAGAPPRLAPPEAQRLVEAVRWVAAGGADRARFAVLEDVGSGRFVQFVVEEGGVVTADFPVASALRPGPPEPLRDQGCSTRPRRPRPGEVERRYRSADEERRLVRLLGELKAEWVRLYCEQRTAAGARAGFLATLRVRVQRAEDAPALAAAVFDQVYRLPPGAPVRVLTGE